MQLHSGPKGGGCWPLTPPHHSASCFTSPAVTWRRDPATGDKTHGPASVQNKGRTQCWPVERADRVGGGGPPGVTWLGQVSCEPRWDAAGWDPRVLELQPGKWLFLAPRTKLQFTELWQTASVHRVFTMRRFVVLECGCAGWFYLKISMPWKLQWDSSSLYTTVNSSPLDSAPSVAGQVLLVSLPQCSEL